MIKISVDELIKLPKSNFSGKTICFITDTVWGIGCVLDENVQTGINKIYELKKRSFDKPLAVLVSDISDILNHVEITSNYIYDLMKLWPGALTLIFNKSDEFYDLVTSTNTIGIRIPNSKIALKLLNYLGPVVTTSINISGEESLNDPKQIEDRFGDQIDYLVTDVHELSKTSSTVVDVTTNIVKVLRQGDIKINV